MCDYGIKVRLTVGPYKYNDDDDEAPAYIKPEYMYGVEITINHDPKARFPRDEYMRACRSLANHFGQYATWHTQKNTLNG